MRMLFRFSRKLRYVPLSFKFFKLALKAVFFKHKRYIYYCSVFALVDLGFYIITHYYSIDCVTLKHYFEMGLLAILRLILTRLDFAIVIIITGIYLLTLNYIRLHALAYTAQWTYPKKHIYYDFYRIFGWTLLELFLLLLATFLQYGFIILTVFELATFFVIPILACTKWQLFGAMKTSFEIVRQEFFGVLSSELLFEALFFVIAFLAQLWFYVAVEVNICSLWTYMFFVLLFYLNGVASIAQVVVAYLLLSKSPKFKGSH